MGITPFPPFLKVFNQSNCITCNNLECVTSIERNTLTIELCESCSKTVGIETLLSIDAFTSYVEKLATTISTYTQQNIFCECGCVKFLLKDSIEVRYFNKIKTFNPQCLKKLIGSYWSDLLKI